MSVNSVGSSPNGMVQMLIDMRAQFDDLQRQLSSGQKSTSYAGLGLQRGLAVSLNAQLSAIGSYDNTIDTVSTGIELAQNALSSMSDIGASLRSALANGSIETGNNGQVVAQSSLQQLVALLNTRSGDRYLFSGRATDQPSVASYDEIVNGDGARAGLKQIIAERNQADLGADGLGRLVVSAPTSTSVALTEDAVSPFGFKLGSVTSGLSNATVSGPSGSPASLSVDFSGQPGDGEAMTVGLNLPDGTTANLTLTATTSSPPGANQFTIGATPSDTAANLQAALTTALGAAAGGSLKAASTVAASNDFFSADANNPPQRVAGPPFDSATALTAGTAANSVIWYTGEAASDPARSSATARIDSSLVINYGTRANEDGIRNLVQSAATLAAVSVPSSDPNGGAFKAALDQRMSSALDGSGGAETVTDIQAELAGAQSSMNAVKSAHQQTSNTLNSFLQQIEGVSTEEVGSQLLALQTRMQAAMQTTAMLHQMSLVNFL